MSKARCGTAWVAWNHLFLEQKETQSYTHLYGEALGLLLSHLQQASRLLNAGRGTKRRAGTREPAQSKGIPL